MERKITKPKVKKPRLGWGIRFSCSLMVCALIFKINCRLNWSENAIGMLIGMLMSARMKYATN